ncbi:phosphatidylethanolamine-binding protein [Phaeosphaeria sp. MPI-PUGE-AT-0046c]|nr:phosphatidylethanolamine-binding protein [Phaeosphaeria sp. MPI-PUGE-AT-0046c]
MVAKQLLSLSALLWSAGAQTAPGFPVSASSSLAMAFGNNTVSPPGELIPRGETAQPPSISAPTWRSDERGPVPAVLLMVDLDVPRNGSRVQLLHWLGTNVTQSGNKSLVVGSTFVPYLQPSPPVGDVAHSYTFVVLAQPRNFSIPAQYANLAQSRVPFNTGQFLSDAGLRASDVIGANYIQVQNLTGTATTTFPPPRATATGATASSPAAFPGSAQALGAGGVPFWGGLAAAAVVAGVAV